MEEKVYAIYVTGNGDSREYLGKCRSQHNLSRTVGLMQIYRAWDGTPVPSTLIHFSADARARMHLKKLSWIPVSDEGNCDVMVGRDGRLSPCPR